MLTFIILGLFLQATQPKQPLQNPPDKVKATVLHAKATDLSYIEGLTQARPVSYPERFTVTTDVVCVEPLLPQAWRFIFNLKHRKLVVISDTAKAYYEVPLELLRYRYYALVEGIRRWVANDRAAVKATPDPAERQKLLAKHLPVWLRTENFLRNPDPKVVKSSVEEQKEPIKGLKAKKVTILADDKEIVSVTLTSETVIKKEVLNSIVGALGLPPAVAKELLKFSGLPLKYRQHLQIGAFHEIRQIEVERLTQTKVKRSALCVPQGYKKIENPPFVTMLKTAKRKFGGNQKPSTSQKQPDKTKQHKEEKPDQGR